MASFLLRDFSLSPDRRTSLKIVNGRIVEMGTAIVCESGIRLIEGHGHALLLGLNDHHLHILAAAASATSIDCGPPSVMNEAALSSALHTAPQTADGWIRGIGYHEEVAGHLDRDRLDALGPQRPIRLQHRSGSLWIINSAGLAAIGDGVEPAPSGLEVDDAGKPTGRLYRADQWLARRIGTTTPDIRALGQTLLRLGVTGITDATADLPPAALKILVDAINEGSLPQQLCILGANQVDLPPGASDQVALGPRKVILADDNLPDLPTLCHWIRTARATSSCTARAVAVHCTSRAALVLLLAAWSEVGNVAGDRIEHAAVVPVDLFPAVRRSGAVVVTQPSFVAERGEAYIAEADASDIPDLYRLGSLLRAGVAVALSSDGPFAKPDPWHTIRSASKRRTANGVVLGPAERIDPMTAMSLMQGSLLRPGRTRSAVTVGMVANLILTDATWPELQRQPTADHIRGVMVRGQLADELFPSMRQS